MSYAKFTVKEIARVRMCWEQVTGWRLSEGERARFADKLADHADLAQYRSEHLRAFAHAALEGWGTQDKSLRLSHWLASVKDSRDRKQTPWAHARCVVSQTAKFAYKHRADFKGICAQCGKAIECGDRIVHSY